MNRRYFGIDRGAIVAASKSVYHEPPELHGESVWPAVPDIGNTVLRD
jgi:hypothetical protein